jgi:hypothetical protein
LVKTSGSSFFQASPRPEPRWPGTFPKHLTNSKQVAKLKGDKMPPKGAAASVMVHHVGPQAPIVMGRSVSLHHKSKLHHVKMKPPDSNENLASADGPQ